MEMCVENFLLGASNQQNHGKKTIQQHKWMVQKFKSPCVREFKVLL
jgi:hypothetical protein